MMFPGGRLTLQTTGPNKDFDAVCSLAGLDPKRVRAYAAAKLAPDVSIQANSRKALELVDWGD